MAGGGRGAFMRRCGLGRAGRLRSRGPQAGGTLSRVSQTGDGIGDWCCGDHNSMAQLSGTALSSAVRVSGGTRPPTASGSGRVRRGLSDPHWVTPSWGGPHWVTRIHPTTTWTHPETARFRPLTLCLTVLTICEEKSVKTDPETSLRVVVNSRLQISECVKSVNRLLAYNSP